MASWTGQVVAGDKIRLFEVSTRSTYPQNWVSDELVIKDRSGSSPRSDSHVRRPALDACVSVMSLTIFQSLPNSS